MGYGNDVEQGLAGPLTDPGNQLSIALKSSQLKGVLGVRLFDAAGRFVETFPPELRDGQLETRALPQLKQLRPVCRFHPAARLSRVFYPTKGKGPASHPPVPLLEVNVALYTAAEARLAGVAQFLIEGQGIASEYARLDRHLALQALGAFGAGGVLLVTAVAGLSLRG